MPAAERLDAAARLAEVAGEMAALIQASHEAGQKFERARAPWWLVWLSPFNRRRTRRI
jgi:hypothetical protein